MNLITWNVNGIRAVERKGELNRLIREYCPNILLLQETKATAEKLSAELREHPEYFQHYHSAQKPGYSGTAIWIKKSGIRNPEFFCGAPEVDDDEGRICGVHLSDRTVLSVYFPNGGKSPEAWEGKMVFYDQFLSFLNRLRNEGRKVIWAGDVNCAHEEIDIARPKENKDSIGFLPEERAWVSKVIENDWVDVFRERNPETVVYSWWHLLSGARKRDVGWRIDYFFVDRPLFSTVRNIEYLTDQMGSDHCPVKMETEND